MALKNIRDLSHHTSHASPKTSVSSECSGRLTPSVGEGPFYKTGSPERTVIAEEGTAGGKLIVEGYVFSKKCQTIANAWLDFWQADGTGTYDNAGYNLRGHQYTDETGRYHLETVRPIQYGPRTAHIHVKVRANNDSPVLTAQLFFPGEERNQKDPIFNSSLVMNIADVEGYQKATFNFVLDVA